MEGRGIETTVTRPQSSGSRSSTMQRLGELSFLYELSKDLTATLDADEIARAVLRWVNDGINGEVAALLLPDAATSRRSWRLLVNAFGVDAQAVSEQMKEQLLSGMQAASEQMDQESAVEIVVVEMTGVELSVANGDASKLESFLSVPLVVGGETIGMLGVGSLVPQAFHATHLRILSTIVNQAAVAINNARLFAQTLFEKQRLDTILTNMADGLLIMDRDGRARFVNPASEAIFGRTREELVGQQFGLPMVSGDTTQLELVQPAGRVIPVEMRVAEVEWDGEVAYLASLRDVTERERTAEALRAAEAYSKNLIDNSLDMIISVDNERRIVEFNRGAQIAFGYEKVEVVGKCVDILYAEPAEGSKVNDTTLRTGHCIAEVINVRKNGETFVSLLSASVLPDAHGRMLGVMGISQDITERKQAEERLQEASR